MAPVMVYEGSLEMEALAAGVLRVITGEERPLRFPRVQRRREEGTDYG
jgi:butyrate kinase